MLQHPLGNTGFVVSALGFGAGHIGSPELDDAAAGRLLNEALDLGITLFDTARGYGLSEERIGRHLAHRRDEFVLVTKCGYGIADIPDWTPACIEAGIDEALRRLRTDRIDVMILHSCPHDVLAHAGVVEALQAAVKAGKVRVAGYSGENQDLEWAVASGAFGVVEASVNLFDQRILDHTLPEAQRRGMGFIAKRPLANAPWRFTDRPHGDYAEVYWERMRAMGLTPGSLEWAEFALRFAAFQPGVGTALVGTSRRENLVRNAEAVDKGPLPAETIAFIRSAFRDHDRDWAGQL